MRFSFDIFKTRKAIEREFLSYEYAPIMHQNLLPATGIQYQGPFAVMIGLGVEIGTIYKVQEWEGRDSNSMATLFVGRVNTPTKPLHLDKPKENIPIGGIEEVVQEKKINLTELHKISGFPYGTTGVLCLLVEGTGIRDAYFKEGSALTPQEQAVFRKKALAFVRADKNRTDVHSHDDEDRQRKLTKEKEAHMDEFLKNVSDRSRKRSK